MQRETTKDKQKEKKENAKDETKDKEEKVEKRNVGFLKRLFSSKAQEPGVEEGKFSKPKLTPEEQDKLNGELLQAVESNNIDSVKTYLNLGADVNAQNKEGKTALMQAARQGLTYICKFLIKNGADVNTQNTLGRTALIVAAWNGRADTCKLLMENGADVNSKDKEGLTALMATVSRYFKINSVIVEYLLSVGANPLLENNKGKRAFDFANNVDLLEELEKYEAIWESEKLDEIYPLMRLYKYHFKTSREFKKFIASRLKRKWVNFADNIYNAVKDCSPAKISEIFVGI